MSLVATLEPRRDPNESLYEGLQYRPALSMDSTSGLGVILGRGSFTGISDTSIGENLVRLSFDEHAGLGQSIKATLLTGDAQVCINGAAWTNMGEERYLVSGDYLSLLDLRYEYKVVVRRSEYQSQSS